MKNNLLVFAGRNAVAGYMETKTKAIKCLFSKLYPILACAVLSFSTLSLFAGNGKTPTKKNITTKPMGKPTGSLAKLWVNMYSITTNGLMLADGVACTFYPSYNNAVDNADAPKFNSFNTKESLCIMRDGSQLAIEKRQPITGYDTTNLQMIQMNFKSYEFQFVAQNWDPLVAAYLKDAFMGTLTPINLSMAGDTTKYDFDVTAADMGSKEADRFSIVFAPVGELPVLYNSVKAFEQGGNVNVEWTMENELNITQYSIEKSTDGRNFRPVATQLPSESTSATKKYRWTDYNIDYGTQYYRISNVNRNGSRAYSVIMKVNYGKANSVNGISVYPTIITDRTASVQFNNIPKGQYALRVISTTGAVVYTKNINYTGGNGTETIRFDKLLGKGMYQLSIVGPENFSHTAKLISR